MKIHIQKFINLVSLAQNAASIFLVILMRQNMYAVMPQLYLKKPRSWRRNWTMMPKQQRRMQRKRLEKKSNGVHGVISNYELLEAWKRDRLDRAKASGEEPPPDQLLAKGRVLIEENLHGKCQFDWEILPSQIDSGDSQPIESRNQGGSLPGFGNRSSLMRSTTNELRSRLLTSVHVYLNVIHASLLRKHMERLEPLESEQGSGEEPTSENAEENVPSKEDFGPESPKEANVVRYKPEKPLGSLSYEPQVQDVHLIMDHNSMLSKGVRSIFDMMSVPMAIALPGQLLLVQPLMIKLSEVEKNLVQSITSASAGALARKRYVGNLKYSKTEEQVRQVFEPLGTVEMVQLPLY